MNKKRVIKVILIGTIIVLLLVLVYKVFARPFKIKGAERISGLNDDKVVLAYSRAVFTSPLEKGDIVVFAEPNSDYAMLIGVVNNVPGEVVDEAVDYTTKRNSALDTEEIELTSSQYGVSYSRGIYVVTDSQIHYKGWYQFK